MKPNLKKYFSWLVLNLGISLLAHAEIQISVTGANVRRARMAVGLVHALAGNPTPDPALASQIRGQVLSDLEFMNIFEFAPDTAVTPLDPAKEAMQINYESWSNMGTTFVLKMGYSLTAGKLTFDAALYDVPGRKKVVSQRYQYPSSGYVRVVHALSEDILKALTGERGLFQSRLLMVCWDTARKHSPPKEVYLTDADGGNFTQLTNDGTISMSPAWVHDGRHITYTQFGWVADKGVRKRANILKKHDLNTGKRTVISSRDGMNSGAAWSPNGSKGAVTMSFTGRPELYLVNSLGAGEPEPLSRNIKWRTLTGSGFERNDINLLFDVEPSWAPDGQKLVFSSARTGHPMIYVVDLLTSAAQQLTFAGQYNASPTWSPKGDKILFAAQRTGEGNFDVYMIDPDGNNLSRITVGDRPGRKINSENPSWGPTGRHFAYGNNETGKYAVYLSTADGLIKRRISPENRECNMPEWGSAE